MTRTVWFLFMFAQMNSVFLWGQWEDISCEEKVYDSNILTPQLRPYNTLELMPILPLNGNQYLQLTFDDFTGEPRNLEYTVIHCSRDWQPSVLNTMEYIDGFATAPLQQFEFSFQTINSYIHYQEILPNSNFTFKLSGNYLLIVFDADTEKLLFTKRFMVADPKVKIDGKVDVPIGEKYWSHHEIRFSMLQPERENFDQREITATILKNRNWHSALINIPPRIETAGKLDFDYFGKIVFEMGHEFRFADLRNIRVTAPEIVSLQRFDDGYEINLWQDKKRSDYFFRKDINGDFLIDMEIRSDNVQPLIRANEVGFRADYLDVFFSLKSSQPLDEKVYITGAFSNWTLNDTFEMKYNEEERQYEIWLFLKQGYYNYAYVTKTTSDQKIGSWLPFEGNYADTRNDYQVLLYYRPFGGRYDQLIGHTILE